jgi:hypothetical protein
MEIYLEFFLRNFEQARVVKSMSYGANSKKNHAKRKKGDTRPRPIPMVKTDQLKAQGSLDRSKWIGSKIQRSNTRQHTGQHTKSWEGSQ